MKIELNKIYHADNAKFTPQIPDGFLDVILEDPPYLYLKNQKLDRPFDELAHFTECYRMLRKGGFIVIFGRGESFYRWNTILADLGFTFKEEVIWDKQYSTSPALRLSRTHETVSIWSKGNRPINKVKIPYLEMKGHDVEAICGDVKRLASILGNQKDLLSVKQYLKDGNPYRDNVIRQKESVTIAANSARKVNVSCMVMQMFKDGQVEKSIIRNPYDRYSRVHPTQKPQRLLERLLALVIPQEKTRNEIKVADFFGGSCNTAKACITLGVNYIITEIDKEYFDLGHKNVEKFKEEFQPSLFV